MNVNPRNIHASMKTTNVHTIAALFIPDTAKIIMVTTIRLTHEQQMIAVEYLESLRESILIFLVRNARISPMMWIITLYATVSEKNVTYSVNEPWQQMAQWITVYPCSYNMREINSVNCMHIKHDTTQYREELKGILVNEQIILIVRLSVEFPHESCFLCQQNDQAKVIMQYLMLCNVKSKLSQFESLK